MGIFFFENEVSFETLKMASDLKINATYFFIPQWTRFQEYTNAF